MIDSVIPKGGYILSPQQMPSPVPSYSALGSLNNDWFEKCREVRNQGRDAVLHGAGFVQRDNHKCYRTLQLSHRQDPQTLGLMKIHCLDLEFVSAVMQSSSAADAFLRRGYRIMHIQAFVGEGKLCESYIRISIVRCDVIQESLMCIYIYTHIDVSFSLKSELFLIFSAFICL